jgi:hypothetical protein
MIKLYMFLLTQHWMAAQEATPGVRAKSPSTCWIHVDLSLSKMCFLPLDQFQLVHCVIYQAVDKLEALTDGKGLPVGLHFKDRGIQEGFDSGHR